MVDFICVAAAVSVASSSVQPGEITQIALWQRLVNATKTECRIPETAFASCEIVDHDTFVSLLPPTSESLEDSL